MNKKLQFKSLILLVALLLGGVGSAWAADEVYYTLTPASGTNNSYAGNCDIKIGDITWNLTGNSQQNPWRLGGKNLDKTDRAVFSKTAMGSAITKVELSVGTASNITVNSLKMIVASDVSFANDKIIDEVTAEFEANSTISFTPTTTTPQWAAGAFYKFVFNVSVNGNNKYVEFVEAKFYKESSKTATTTEIVATGLTNTNLFTGTSAGQLTATVTAGETPLTDAAITWTSSAPTVATVDESGNVTLVAAGTTNIKATYAGSDSYIGSEATYELTVVNNDPSNKKATFDFSANKYNWESTSENNTYFDGSGYNATEEDITIGFSGKVRLWLSNDEYTMRFYADDTYGPGKMTLTAGDGYVITGVSISGSTLSFQNPSSGTINGGEWTGSAKVLSIERGSTSNSTFNKVEVSYKEGKAPTVTINATGITNTNVFDGTAAGKLSATVTYNETAVEGATVTWSGNNDDVATIDASTGAVTLVAAGSVTFTATFAGNTNYTETSATYKMTVTNIDPNAPGTVNNPYTVAQARAAIDDATGTQNVYATGIVSEIVTEYNSEYGNISYNISADGSTESDQLQAFRGKGIGKANFTSANDIQVGDVVVIKGNLTKYNTTYEFSADNQLVSLQRPVTIPASKYTTFASSMPISFAGTAVTAYTAKVEGKVAKLSAISDNIVPANTGVILYAETAGNYFGALSATTGGSPSVNEMVGVTAETAVPWTADNKYNYILQGGVFKKATGAKLHAGKAYLSIEKPAASRELNIVFEGEATAIKAIETANDKSVYDLQGRKVAAPTKGLYIINGKKMIVK